MIEFAAMKVGDSVKLEGATWEGKPREAYNEAQAYALSMAGAKQFEVTAGWALLSGFEVREYTLTRTK